MNSLPQRAQTPRSPQTAPPLTLPSPRPISTCREKEVTPRQRAAVRAGADPLRTPAPQREAPRPGRGPPSRGRAGKGGFTPAGPPSRQPSRRGTTRFGPPPPSLAARCFTLHPSPAAATGHQDPGPRACAPSRQRGDGQPSAAILSSGTAGDLAPRSRVSAGTLPASAAISSSGTAGEGVPASRRTLGTVVRGHRAALPAARSSVVTAASPASPGERAPARCAAAGCWGGPGWRCSSWPPRPGWGRGRGPPGAGGPGPAWYLWPATPW